MADKNYLSSIDDPFGSLINMDYPCIRYMRCSDMWLGSGNYIDRGSSGDVSVPFPVVHLS